MVSSHRLEFTQCTRVRDVLARLGVLINGPDGPQNVCQFRPTDDRLPVLLGRPGLESFAMGWLPLVDRLLFTVDRDGVRLCCQVIRSILTVLHDQVGRVALPDPGVVKRVTLERLGDVSCMCNGWAFGRIRLDEARAYLWSIVVLLLGAVEHGERFKPVVIVRCQSDCFAHLCIHLLRILPGNQ